jgi:hypothetical protein
VTIRSKVVSSQIRDQRVRLVAEMSIPISPMTTSAQRVEFASAHAGGGDLASGCQPRCRKIPSAIGERTSVDRCTQTARAEFGMLSAVGQRHGVSLSNGERRSM